jgi:hypothetical protein
MTCVTPVTHGGQVYQGPASWLAVEKSGVSSHAENANWSNGVALAFAAAAQQPIIYAAKGQGPQKQNSDTAECQLWAKQTTRIEPLAWHSNPAYRPLPSSKAAGSGRGRSRHRGVRGRCRQGRGHRRGHGDSGRRLARAQ